MKKFVLVFTSALLVLILMSSVQPARAGFSFEDPQLCVNGRLLTVIPASPGDVYVKVPTGTVVDYVVANCGGTDLPVQESNVKFTDKIDDTMVVRAVVDAGTQVTFVYGTVTKVRTNDDDVTKVKFALP
jgi:hypothetical protein